MSTESEFAGEADRASTVVHEQIVSMIDSARGAAMMIERRARDADEERRRADEQASKVLETLHGVESELALLLSHVGREADALRAALERSRLRAAAGVLGAESPSRGPGGATDATAVEDRAPSLLDPEPAATETPSTGPSSTDTASAPAAVVADGPAKPEPVMQTETVEPEPVKPPSEDEPVEPDTADPPGEQTAEEPATVPPDATSSEEEESLLTPSPVTDGGGDLDAAARSRVAAKTDLELAELHGIASRRFKKGSQDQRSYWQALVTATVDEASTRATFGEPGEGEDLGSRRAKRQRAKVLKPLTAAREAAQQDAERN